MGEIGVVSPLTFYYKKKFVMENGVLESLQLCYETYGTLNNNGTNAILVCHALTGDHHVAGIYKESDRKGWWDHAVGPGKAIDTNKYFVICSNCLGACQGSTGPSSINPKTKNPYRMGFPDLTIKDMVRAQKLLLDHLKVTSLYSVVGGSMGGMQPPHNTVHKRLHLMKLAEPLLRETRDGIMEIIVMTLAQRRA